jgi:hypothetical protein
MLGSHKEWLLPFPRPGKSEAPVGLIRRLADFVTPTC